jgi:hypothetical protein
MPYDATDFVVTEAAAPVRDPKSITDPRERIVFLRDFLRELPAERFDMRTFGRRGPRGTGPAQFCVRVSGDTCSTAACIAGWANLLWAQQGQRTNAHRRAATFLGLDLDMANKLFWPSSGSGFDSTPAQAANVLDHYLTTGEISWAAA